MCGYTLNGGLLFETWAHEDPMYVWAALFPLGLKKLAPEFAIGAIALLGQTLDTRWKKSIVLPFQIIHFSHGW